MFLKHSYIKYKSPSDTSRRYQENSNNSNFITAHISSVRLFLEYTVLNIIRLFNGISLYCDIYKI